MSLSLKATGGSPAPTPPPGIATLALAHWPGDVAVLGVDLRVEWINDRFAQRIGLGAAACPGVDWLALHPTAAVHAGEYRRAARGVTVELPPFPSPGPDGLGFHAATLQPLYQDGNVVGLLVTERDVAVDLTGRPGLEEALARSQEQFRFALECAQIGFYEWNVPDDTVSGLEVWCSARNVLLEGGRPGQATRWESLVHPDDRIARRRAFDGHRLGSTDFCEVEYRIPTADGRWLWVFDRAQISAWTADGRPHRVLGICMEIDRQRRAELALRESESRLAATVWGTGIGLWELDTAGAGARWFNDWCEQEDLHPCVGLDHVDAWDANVHPEDLPRAAALFAALLDGRHDVYESEYRIRTRSGRWIWIFERGRATERGQDNRPRRIVGICMNIEARKQVEQALRASQIRLRSIAEHSTDWLILLDATQQIVFVNRPIHGVSPDKLQGHAVAGLLPAHDRGRILAFLAAALGGEDMQPPLEHFLADERHGSRTFLVGAQPVRAEAGIVGAVLTITEITRQRRDEGMLRLQARILETMREGVVLLDERNTIRLTNPAFDALFGFSAGELEGRPVGQLFLLDDVARRRDDPHHRVQLMAGPATHSELECCRRDGSTFTASCVVTPLVVDGANHWLTVLNDISERKLLEREILEVSNREQQRIGNDLHDGLGQELTGVALMLRSLSTRVRRSHPDAIPEVDEIVTLLNQSIHNTRSLARGLSPVALERGGLLPALRMLAARGRETHGLSLSVRTRITEPLSIDDSAASHLYRIVQEALNNATRHGRATRVVIQLTSDRLAIRLSVHDNGRGLPPETNRQPGLGLRTMHYRARIIGGKLEVSNHRRGGTVVRCVCPQGASERISLAHAHARAHARAHAHQYGVRKNPDADGDG